MKVNYHTHSHFCDGKGSPEDYIKEAIKRGFTSLGFSSHAPIKEENDWAMQDDQIEIYLDHINSLKDKYRDILNIHVGLEIDYYSDENRFETFSKYGFEYFIGSVHTVNGFSIDESNKVFSEVLRDVFKDMKTFAHEYYKVVRELISQGGFDILGHIDLIGKFNREYNYFSEDEPWYISEISETLDLLIGKDIIVEVNTGAICRGHQDRPYPALWILKEMFSRDIKVCLNSDAHNINGIDCFFDEALEMIKNAGYSELTTPFETIKI